MTDIKWNDQPRSGGTTDRHPWNTQLSIRAIARSTKASPSTVGDYIRRSRVAGLSWPLPEGMDEHALEAKLFPPPQSTRIPRHLPEWPVIHQELRRKGVTLALLWHEYKTEHPDGLQYSWFCERYRAWARHLDVVIRQEQDGDSRYPRSRRCVEAERGAIGWSCGGCHDRSFRGRRADRDRSGSSARDDVERIRLL